MKQVMPLCFSSRSVCAQTSAISAHATVRDEDLGAVEDVAVAVFSGGGGHGGRVGAGYRLGEAITAQDFPGRQARQVLLLLLLGAEVVQRAS